MIRETWKCPCCEAELSFSNCNEVRSDEVAQGASHSRSQPDFNLRLIKGSIEVGINTTKLQELVTEQLGIKIANEANLRKQATKVQAAINSTFEEHKMDNPEEHHHCQCAFLLAEPINNPSVGPIVPELVYCPLPACLQQPSNLDVAFTPCHQRTTTWTTNRKLAPCKMPREARPCWFGP